MKNKIQAQVGDTIQIVNTCSAHWMKKGDLFIVNHLFGPTPKDLNLSFSDGKIINCVSGKVQNKNWYCSPDDYIIIQNNHYEIY